MLKHVFLFTGGSSTGPIVFSQMLQGGIKTTMPGIALTNDLQLSIIEAD